VPLVFFFKKKIDAALLARALEQALARVPVFAARMAVVGSARYIRCEGQGAPFTVVSSNHTLDDAMQTIREDRGQWLVDMVKPGKARMGRRPLFTVRITYLADGATAIGCCWHHAVADTHSFMLLMNAWVAAASGDTIPEPLTIEDRIAYLDEHLPPDGNDVPAVRVRGIREYLRSAFYSAVKSPAKRTVALSFGDEELARMRAEYGKGGAHVSMNDVLCAHVCDAIIASDPVVRQYRLSMTVNFRKRCGLDELLIGNMLSTVPVDVANTDDAATIAARIRRGLSCFAEKHSNMRCSQQFVDKLGPMDRLRIAPTRLNPVGRNLLVTSWSNFGLYDVCFEGTRPFFVTPLMGYRAPWFAIVVEHLEGRGRLFVVSLPPKVADAMTTPSMLARLHRFRESA
jgi:hypothetical protein